MSAYLTVNLFAQGKIFLIKDNLTYLEYKDTTLNVSKTKAYQLTKLWIAKTFNSSGAVTDLDDPNSGTLIVKYLFDTKTVTKSVASDEPLTVFSFIKATMQIDIRDNKIRIRTSDLEQAIALDNKNDNKRNYQLVNDAIQRLMSKGQTIESISSMDLYKTLIDTVNTQSKSLTDFIKESVKDDF